MWVVVSPAAAPPGLGPLTKVRILVGPRLPFDKRRGPRLRQNCCLLGTFSRQRYLADVPIRYYSPTMTLARWLRSAGFSFLMNFDDLRYGFRHLISQTYISR